MKRGAGQPSADVHDADEGTRLLITITARLYLTRPEAELLRPLPEDSLDVATVREGSG
jgi:hypothetical protein